MKAHQDAFGQSLYDYLRGEPGPERVERDDGLIEDDFNLETYFAPFAKWTGQERKAIQFARGRVVDIGCGAGRHSLYLQKKGLKVTGIDVSPLALKVCRARGLKDARRLSIQQIGPKLGLIDTIIMMGNNFGLFGSPTRARTLLKRFYRLMPPSGRIIAQTLDPYGTDNPYHLSYHRFNLRRGRWAGQLRLRVRYKNHIGSWFDYLFVSRKELEGLLKGTGWKISKLFQDKGPIYTVVLEKNMNREWTLIHANRFLIRVYSR